MTSATGGRTAVVTGASRGIGLAIAKQFASMGIRVAMLARRANALHEAARDVGDLAVAIPCDVSNAKDVDAAVARVRDGFGEAPDILVNNVGLFRLAPAHMTDPGDFEATLEANLVAPFRFIRAFLPAMRLRKRGHVVFIGSVADRVPFPDNAAYVTTKFGLRGMHEVLRLELAGSGVRTTLVSPGPVNTPLWDDVNPDEKPGFLPRSAMLGADAVAAAVAFAVSQPADVSIDELRLSRA